MIHLVPWYQNVPGTRYYKLVLPITFQSWYQVTWYWALLVTSYLDVTCYLVLGMYVVMNAKRHYKKACSGCTTYRRNRCDSYTKCPWSDSSVAMTPIFWLK